jgi:hypothetical protein
MLPALLRRGDRRLAAVLGTSMGKRVLDKLAHLIGRRRRCSAGCVDLSNHLRAEQPICSRGLVREVTIIYETMKAAQASLNPPRGRRRTPGSAARSKAALTGAPVRPGLRRIRLQAPLRESGLECETHLSDRALERPTAHIDEPGDGRCQPRRELALDQVRLDVLEPIGIGIGRVSPVNQRCAAGRAGFRSSVVVARVGLADDAMGVAAVVDEQGCLPSWLSAVAALLRPRILSREA